MKNDRNLDCCSVGWHSRARIGSSYNACESSEKWKEWGKRFLRRKPSRKRDVTETGEDKHPTRGSRTKTGSLSLDPRYLVIHHSASESRSPRVWNVIRDYHIEEKGWDDIGYHFGVVPIEGVWEVLVGRPLNTHGAHVQGYNEKAIGVCFVGNYDIHPPSNIALDTAVPTLRWLVNFFDIPEENFVGHNAFANTLCPGRYFPMPQLRREVFHG